MIESNITAFVALLIVAAAVAVLAEQLPIPYVSALALTGVAIGVVVGPQHLHLTHALLLFVLLPGLLFEAGFNLRWSVLRPILATVVVLATVGVLITTAVVATLGVAVLGLSLPVAVLFGAMIAPTDPVAVIGVFRRMGMPDRLTAIVEAESLLNDGTGVVIFTIALAATTAPLPSLPAVLLQFGRLALGGVGVGLALGVGLSWLTTRIDHPHVELTFTAIGAYGSYLLAEGLHVSGILAVVAAALVLGNYGRPRGMAERTEAAVSAFWDYVAFLLNSAVFLLIGLDIPWESVVAYWPAVLLGSTIVFLARAAAVYALFAPARLVGRALPWRWQHVIVWSGMRGAVAIALVLSISDQGGPELDLVRALVYGVVLMSILIQGGTIGPLSARLLPQGEEPGTANAPG